MNLLTKFFFPGVPYPAALVWHLILGSSVAAIIGYFGWGYHGEGYALPILGAVLGIIAGGLVAHRSKPKQ